MKIIILEKNKKLGNVGDIVKVKSGYARNFLIPQKKAILANKYNINKLKFNINEHKKRELKILEEKKSKIKSILEIGVIKIKVKSSNVGRLFGSVNNRTISKVLINFGIQINKNDIILPYSHIRKVGIYNIKIKVNGTTVDTKISISSE